MREKKAGFRTKFQVDSPTLSLGKVPRISISGLRKLYGQKVALENIDLKVEPGQFLVLLGPSGSGKSTLLRCLAGIETPTEGTICFDDSIVSGPGCYMPPEKRNLAMVFQDYALWPHLNAEQNVSFALQRTGVSPNERKQKSLTMLEQVGLSGLAARYPSQLSGGEQQRVGLARALVADPGIMLFDEPLSNLDADRREKLRVDISSMVRRHGATAIYITHDQAEAFALADVIGVMNGGRLVQVGTPEEIYRSPADAFVARFTGLAGELSGTVVSLKCGKMNEMVAVEVEGSLIYGKRIGDGTLSVGQKAKLLLRPSALSFVGKPNFQNGHTSNSHSSEYVTHIESTILDAAFRGWGYEHVIALCGDFRLSGVPAGRRLPFMSKAAVAVSPEGCLVIADDRGDSLVPEHSVSTASDQIEAFQYLVFGSEF